MSSKRDTIINIDVNNCSRDDIIDLYTKLASDYRRLKDESEVTKQELHHHQQQTKLLKRSQSDLQNELDGINEANNAEINAVMKINNGIVESLKKSKQEIESDKSLLETKLDELLKKLNQQDIEIKELRTKIVNKKPAPRISDSFSINLEIQIESLKESQIQVCGKLEEEIKESRAKNLHIEELREKILCLEDNLESKKSEIEEKNESLESLHEQLNELTVENALLKTAPDESNRKGNSLFSEVDDQRQKMKSILKNERAHYNDMKKLFNSKEMEIRRLKRENHNIKTEIQTCSSLLRRGQQIELQTLNNQVGFLHNENRKLSKELTEMEKKLKDLASDQNLEWIQSLMTSATFETRDLKDKLMREMMEKTSLSDNFARAQRELAKARLDCVKLKILLGRIVDANGIKIDENDFDDIDIEQEVLENLKIEEFESLDGSMTLETMDDGTELNESTITLIGGRERLGNFIPPKEEKIELDSKENLKVSSSPKPSISPRIEPLKPIPIPKHSSNKEESKVVNFSSTVETKVIETTRAQFEESNQARKRNPIVVKRIVISSRATKKIE